MRNPLPALPSSLTAIRSTRRYCSGTCRQMAYYARLRARPAPRKLTPERNAPESDLVPTPYALARVIVRHFRPTGRCLDPCRGPARPFYTALKAQRGCVVDWCEVTEGRDFMAYSLPTDWIVTNPPWSKVFPFLRHAMTLADNVVFLAALSAFTLRARMRAIELAGFGLKESLLVPHPPRPWPASGFQLAAVHIQRGYAGPFVLTR